MPRQNNTEAEKPKDNLLLPDKTERKDRKPGGLKGRVWISDAFGEPMSEEELALWYEGLIFPEDGTKKVNA